MLNTNINTKTNTINVVKSINQTTSSLSVNWLQQTNVTDNVDLSNHYAHIFNQHKQDKKWVLFINPEVNSIEKLAKIHGIDISKILMVNYKSTPTSRANVTLEKITSVLSKGNCSAVILSNSLFEADEIAQLEISAKLGQTHCILVKKSQLH